MGGVVLVVHLQIEHQTLDHTTTNTTNVDIAILEDVLVQLQLSSLSYLSAHLSTYVASYLATYLPTYLPSSFAWPSPLANPPANDATKDKADIFGTVATRRLGHGLVPLLRVLENQEPFWTQRGIDRAPRFQRYGLCFRERILKLRCIWCISFHISAHNRNVFRFS